MSNPWRNRLLYWGTATVSATVLLTAGFVGLDAVIRALGGDWDDAVLSVPFLLVPPLALAALTARWARRRFGVPVQDHHVETLVRSGGTAAPGDTIQIPQFSLAGTWSIIIQQLFFMAISVFTRSKVGAPWRAECRLLIPAFMLCWVVWYLRSFRVIEAGAEGIRHRPWFGRRGKHTPWERIASCTIESVTYPWINVKGSRCVFRDAAGRELLRLRVGSTDVGQGAQFMAMVREHQGMQSAPSELMASEAPEGTGLEPEASMAPAGRGTEPVAALAAEVAPGMPGSHVQAQVLQRRRQRP